MASPTPTVSENESRNRALCGWSPPDLVAGARLKRAADRFLPRTGIPVVAFFVAIAALLLLAPLFPRREELAVDCLAALAAGGWCAINFWLCRQAHCLVTAGGWLALALFTFFEAGLGRTLIHGDEQLVFLGIFVASLVFECGWSAARGSNALVRRT